MDVEQTTGDHCVSHEEWRGFCFQRWQKTAEKRRVTEFFCCCAVGFALVLRWNVRKAKQVQKQHGYKNHDTTKPERLSRRA